MAWQPRGRKDGEETGGGMNTTPTRTASTRWIRTRRALRRFGFHRNAMCRPLDRVQSIIGLGLSLVFLALGPLVAARAVQHAYDAGARTEQRQNATRHRVDATVVQRYAPGSGITGQVVGARERVEWPAADGARHSGVLGANKPVGAHMTLWVDDSEAVKAAPQARTQTIGAAAFAGAGGLAAIAVPLALAYMLIRRRFDRRRFAEWDEEWSLISPHWTGRG
jgi:hypothetical protein